MPTRTTLLDAIATTICDYRTGELAAPTPEHIDKWVKQFDDAVQLSILTEMDFALRTTYFSRARVERFLSNVIKHEPLTGANPCVFWKEVNFLRIQQLGESQRVLLEIFDTLLQANCGFGINQCGSTNGPFIYLDDALFGGGHIRNDITKWVRAAAPRTATLHVITIATHTAGQEYTKGRIQAACKEAKKTLDLRWLRGIAMENQSRHNSDVLHPTRIPLHPLTQAYAQGLTRAPLLRAGASVGPRGVFSSPKGREILEQEFLKAGAYIRSICPQLIEYQRPLGNSVLENFGFGAMIVTYRNCPNNCPLALWAGYPWYPLFPRKTN